MHKHRAGDMPPRGLSVLSVERERGGTAHAAAVLARIEDQSLVLDLRTVFPEQEAALASALAAALR